MPKVELSATLHDRLEAIVTNAMTVEMLVNRAVDSYIHGKAVGSRRGPSPRILAKPVYENGRPQGHKKSHDTTRHAMPLLRF